MRRLLRAARPDPEEEPGRASRHAAAEGAASQGAGPTAAEPGAGDGAASSSSGGEAPAAPDGHASPVGAGAADGAAAAMTGRRTLGDHLMRYPMLRAGVYAWAVIGLAAAAVVVGLAVGQLRLVVVPLVLALFPAALLAPLVALLRRVRVPRALASLATILAVFALLGWVGTILVPQIGDEIPELVASVEEGIVEVETFLDETTPFGIDATEVRTQINELVDQIDVDAALELARAGALGAATAVAEIAGMTLLLVVVLFFYLKDGDRLGRWARNLFPRGVRDDVEAVGLRAWNTVGAYFRGQLLVAVVDAIGIGLGLWILGVPLALPLAVLVFFGGLFPIVGAVVTGAVAVLVALAASGPFIALLVLAIVVGVQQLESNVLAPLVLGRATALHPLAVLVSITAGAILLGVLGAFLAVPIAASVARGVQTLNERREARRALEPAPA